MQEAFAPHLANPRTTSTGRGIARCPDRTLGSIDKVEYARAAKSRG